MEVSAAVVKCIYMTECDNICFENSPSPVPWELSAFLLDLSNYQLYL